MNAATRRSCLAFWEAVARCCWMSGLRWGVPPARRTPTEDQCPTATGRNR